MPVVNKKEYLKCLSESGIASDAQIALWCEACPEDVSVKKLAKSMVQHGYLTAWQAKYLLNGKKKLKFSNYVLLERIKRNEIGDTFVAKQEKLDRKVKIVFLSSPLSKCLQEREELLRQVVATANVDHPGLEHVHVIDWEGGRYFVVTDYVDAHTLDDPEILAGLRPEQLTNILLEIVDATSVAHQNGLSHGAMTEKDIAVDTDGKITVCNMVTSFLIQNLGTENTGPVTKTREDVKAVCTIATRLIRRLQSAAPESTEDVLPVIGKLGRGEIGLLQAKNLLQMKSAIEPMSPPAATGLSPAPSFGTPQEYAEYPATDNFAPDGYRLNMVLRILKGVGAVAAVGFVYYVVTSGLFETQNSHSSRLDRGEEMVPQELPSLNRPESTGSSMPEKTSSTKSDVEVTATNLENVTDVADAMEQTGERNEKQDGVDPDSGKLTVARDLLVDGNTEEIISSPDEGGSSTDKPTSDSTDSILGAFKTIKSESGAPLTSGSDGMDSSGANKAVGNGSQATSDKDAGQERVENATEVDAKFPSYVSLPDVSDPTPSRLAFVDSQDVKLQLLSDENISKSKVEFALGARRNNAWEANLKLGGGTITVGSLSLRDGWLSFAWSPSAAQHDGSQFLVNCVLKVSNTSENNYLQLRKPMPLEGFVVTRDNPQVKLDLKELRQLPKNLVAELHELDEKTYGEIIFEGDSEKRTFSRKQPLVLQFRDLPEYQLLSLALMADLKNRVKLEASLRLQMSPDQKTRTATTKLADAAKLNLEQTIARIQQEHDFLKNTPIDDLRAHYGVTIEQLKNSHRNERVKLLKQQVELHEGRFKAFREIQTQLEPFFGKPLPVTVYFEVQGQRVVLASSMIE